MLVAARDMPMVQRSVLGDFRLRRRKTSGNSGEDATTEVVLDTITGTAVVAVHCYSHLENTLPVHWTVQQDGSYPN